MFADPEGNSLIAAIIIGVLVGVATKYTEDVIYNIVIGEKGWDIFVPSSSWGEYIAAGVIEGVTGGIGNYISAATGSAKIGLTALKYSVDILGRPLLNQTFELALGERQNFDLSKYGMDVIYNNMIILPSKSNLTNYNRIHDLLLKSRYIIYTLFLIFVILILTLLIRIINNPNVKKDIQLLNDGKYVLVECTAIEFDKGGKNTDGVFKVRNDHTGEIFKLSYTGGPIYSGDKFIVIIAPNTNKKCIVMINGVYI